MDSKQSYEENDFLGNGSWNKLAAGRVVASYLPVLLHSVTLEVAFACAKGLKILKINLTKRLNV